MANPVSSSPSDLVSTILNTLDSSSAPLLSSDAFPLVPFADLKAALDRLASRSMVEYKTLESEEVLLEAEGSQILAHGSHEVRVFEALRKAVDGLTVQELEDEIGDKSVTKVGQGKAFREKWIAKGKDGRLVATVCGPPVLFMTTGLS